MDAKICEVKWYDWMLFFRGYGPLAVGVSSKVVLVHRAFFGPAGTNHCEWPQMSRAITVRLMKTHVAKATQATGR